MDALAACISSFIRDELKRQRTVDVAAVAQKIHQNFPDMSLRDISERVFRAVVLQGGDFRWEATGATDSNLKTEHGFESHEPSSWAIAAGKGKLLI